MINKSFLKGDKSDCMELPYIHPFLEETFSAYIAVASEAN